MPHTSGTEAHLWARGVLACMHLMRRAVRHDAAAAAARQRARRAAKVVPRATVAVPLVTRLLGAAAAAVERVDEFAWLATRVRLVAAHVLAAVPRLFLAHRRAISDAFGKAERALGAARVVGAARVRCVLADRTARQEAVRAARGAELERRVDAAQVQRERGVEFLIEPRVRFVGEPGEQATLFLLDPSGNALEFKAFQDIATQLFAR